MSEERKFPLVIYQNTEEYKRAFEEASKKFREILLKVKAKGFKYTFIGDLRLNKNGEFEFWLNSDMPFVGNCKADGAIKYAQTHGIFGWWTLNDFELFSQGCGRIFADAMRRLGFRQSKNNPFKWARITSKEKKQQTHFRDETFYLPLSEKETERLKSLIVFPNNNAGLDKTFSLIVGETRMIHISLDVNPFGASRTEELGHWGALLLRRGHLAKHQEGFSMEAHNIKLGEEKMIYIKATRLDGSFVECVWPTAIPLQGDNNLRALANNLAKIVSAVAVE